jgi:hypothetical protein
MTNSGTAPWAWGVITTVAARSHQSQRRQSMRTYLKLLLLFAITAGTAWLASRILVPDAVPVADSEQPQWYLQLAFFLRSIEWIGLGGMALVVVAGAAMWKEARKECPKIERPTPPVLR